MGRQLNYCSTFKLISLEIKNLFTEEVNSISFNTWLRNSVKTTFQILDRGDTVYLRELRNLPQVKYLYEMDRDHASRMVRSHPHFYDYEELDELPIEIAVKRILLEVSWMKDRTISVKQLFINFGLSVNFTKFSDSLNKLSKSSMYSQLFNLKEGDIFLTMKGLKYLEENNFIELDINELSNRKYSNRNKINDNMIDVFVTYSWDSEEHKSEVLGFCNFLREMGFNATIDRKISQEESAPNFTKMMHQAMTQYNKVIVVLSEGYKKKADAFKSGVGTEYELIINDINDYPKKYILVSLNGIADSIFPLAFKGRQVINLTSDSDLQTLYAKLKDVEQIAFSPVASETPEVQSIKIENFRVPSAKEESLIDIKDISSFPHSGTHKLHNLYFETHHGIKLEFENTSGKVLNGYRVELAIPKDLSDYESEGKITSNSKIFTHESNSKLYPEQLEIIEIGYLLVTNKFAEIAFTSELELRFYCDDGKEVYKYPIKKFLTVSNFPRSGHTQLSLDRYHDKMSRR